MNGRNMLLALAAGMTGVAAVTAPAIAQTAQAKAVVDAAKRQGVVGEQTDGFLGFVTGDAPAEIKAAVAEINAGRAQLYRQAAAQHGVAPEAAGASAFKTVVESKIQPGEYYRTAEGAWVRK